MCRYWLLITLVFILLFSKACYGDTAEEYYDVFGMEKLEEYGDFKNIFNKVLSGDISGALKSADVFAALRDELKNGAEIMRALLLICFINGMTAAVFPCGDKNTGLMAHTVSCLLSAGLCLKVLTGLIKVLSGFADMFLKLVLTVIPITTAVLAVSGNAVLGSSSSALIYTACTVSAAAIKTAVIPCMGFYMVCGVVNCISPRAMLTKLSKLIYGFTVTCLRVSGMVLCAVLALERAAAAGADGLARKAAVSAVRAVPVVGDVFAAGADGVMLLMGSVKSGFGAAVVLLMFLACIVPLVKLFAASMLFRVTAALSEPMGDKRISDMIDTAGGAAMLAFAAALCLSLMYMGAAAALLIGG